jgi:hypothetical protein
MNRVRVVSMVARLVEERERVTANPHQLNKEIEKQIPIAER